MGTYALAAVLHKAYAFLYYRLSHGLDL